MRPEDESQTWHNVLPYTFEDGCLLRYELDGDDDIDQTIDLDNYAVAQRTPFDMDEFEKVNDLLIRILLAEGKEIIREAPFNEEDVVDNRITLTLYDESRNELLSRSCKIGRKAPKKPSTPEPERTYTSEELSDIGESLVRLQRSLTRRVEGRPWINGGAISGVGILLFCFPKVKLADAFFVGLATAYCVTVCWGVLAWLNDLFEDDGNILMPALKSLKRSKRRMARKSFFHNMFGF